MIFTIIMAALANAARGQKPGPDSTGFKLAKSFELHAVPPRAPYTEVPHPSFTTVQFIGKEIVQHLPFFCGAELLIEKRLKVPFRFRLGSVQQTDWLEGKPLSIKPE